MTQCTCTIIKIMRLTHAMEPRNGVMFPSDLQGTNLEDEWVNGYDSTLEENQDQYMEDFWRWCENKCTHIEQEEGEHTIFWFEGDLEII